MERLLRESLDGSEAQKAFAMSIFARYDADLVRTIDLMRRVT